MPGKTSREKDLIRKWNNRSRISWEGIKDCCWRNKTIL